MLDAIVIGSGPNGLVAATNLARAGWSVEVLEAQDTPGGAVRSAEVTLPGFVHDLGAAFFPFGEASTALTELDLPGAGLKWKHAPFDSSHPAPDGTVASIGRDLEASVRSLGVDGDAWRRIATWHARSRERVLDALLSTLPPLRQALRLDPESMLRLAGAGLSSGRGWSSRTFRTEAARRIVPGLALHTDVGPDDYCGAIVGFMLAITSSSAGFAVPEGGTSAITAALLRRLGEAGGRLRTGVRVSQVVVSGGRAVAVRTNAGELEASRAILADVAAPSLYLRLLDPSLVPTPLAESMRNFRHGFGTFKVDWALDGPVPWRSEEAAQAAVVHAGDSLDDLARFTAEVRSGALPSNPYLVIGQQSVADPTRAPEGCHTLWAYSRVPSTTGLPGGWRAARERFADTIEARIEGLAPGFRKRISKRALFAPPDLEAMNENLVGGDITGGSADIRHQLFLRPAFPYFRYRTPVRGLYLCSSYTHPGAGVHGACGRNAAGVALNDEG